MLRELVASLFATAAPGARRLGYVHELVAIEARARRCREPWAAHLAQSRNAVLTAARACAPRRVAMVLGAGALLDIPLDALSQRFQRVVLVDMAYLGSTRRAARRLDNVELRLADLSGTLRGLADPAASAPAIQPCAALYSEPGLDLVISANLLSQLPLLPLAAACRRWPLDEAAQDRLGRRVVEAHLTQLAALSCTVCLITDVERLFLEADGAVAFRQDPLFGARLPEGDEWTWDVAPPGELSGGRAVRTRVRAVTSIRSGSPASAPAA